MSDKQSEFYCPYCISWLVEGGTVHDPNHHNDSDKYDNIPVTRYRDVGESDDSQ